jgi:hypothetical protein
VNGTLIREEKPSPLRVDRDTWADRMGRRRNDALIFVIADRASFYCGRGENDRLVAMAAVACVNAIISRDARSRPALSISAGL